MQTLPGIGPVLGAVLVAEIGDVTWFRGPTYDPVVIARNHDKYPPSRSIENIARDYNLDRKIRIACRR